LPAAGARVTVELTVALTVKSAAASTVKSPQNHRQIAPNCGPLFNSQLAQNRLAQSRKNPYIHRAADFVVGFGCSRLSLGCPRYTPRSPFGYR